MQHARLLLTGDAQTWKYFPYRMRMKIRGIDLGWASAQASGLDEKRSHWHSNSGGPELEELLDTLPIKESDAVLDIGCGKGGALLTLALYPFARVDGVEISRALAVIAQKNLEKLRVRNATVYCGDATEFNQLDSYTYFYMYNPFPEQVMRLVMNNIVASQHRKERRVTLIYKNPLCDVLVQAAGFRKIGESKEVHPDYPSFSVYTADVPASVTQMEARSFG